MGSAFALVLGMTACGVGVSFDGYDTRRRFSVGGTVAGLEGERVTVLLNGTATEVGDGPFTHPLRLVDGADFTVTVAGPSPTHTCAIERGVGAINGADVVDIGVTCSSSDASLKGLVLTGATLSPPFSPDVTRYDADYAGSLVAAMRSRLKITPSRTGARIVADGVVTSPDVAIRPYMLVGKEHELVIEVTAPDGVAKRTYAVRIVPRASLQVVSEDGAPELGRALAINGSLLAATGGDVVRTYSSNGGVFARDALVQHPEPDLAPHFGDAVALCDGRLVVGSAYEDDEAGAVYVLERSGSSWIDAARLVAPKREPRTHFGQSVACGEDRIAVGAPCVDGAALSCVDRVHVFRRANDQWSAEATLAHPFNAPRASFGSAVEMRGDALVVAAVDDSTDSRGVDMRPTAAVVPRSGAVVAFQLSGGSWEQRAYLKASTPKTGARFGKALALGVGLIAVGADDPSSGEGIGPDQGDGAAVRSGAVYIFERADTKYAQVTFVKSTTSTKAGGFGSALALFDDLLTVGAPGEGGGTLHFLVRINDQWQFSGRTLPAGISTFGGTPGIGTVAAIQDDRLVVGTDIGHVHAFGGQ